MVLRSNKDVLKDEEEVRLVTPLSLKEVSSLLVLSL